jgi:putative transposase
VRKRLNKAINHKKIHRIIKLNNWQVIKRPKGHRPRVKGMISRIDVINSRWAVDTTHIFCGRDGWCHLTAVIDCCDRNIMGRRLSKRGIAKIAAAALEDAAVLRKINGTNVVLRSDNGLVFGSEAFTKVVNRYGFIQEFITPYTPEQK